QMQIEIKRIQRDLAVTVIYVTHDQEEALTMSDRVAVMHEGRLAQIGTPFDLYQTPATQFVADFVGKMNFIEGEIVTGDNDEVVVALSPNHRLGGLHAFAGNAGAIEPGNRVRVAVRPERLRLTRRSEEPGILSGVVETTVFVGSFHAFLVRLHDDALIHVHVPAD